MQEADLQSEKWLCKNGFLCLSALISLGVPPTPHFLIHWPLENQPDLDSRLYLIYLTSIVSELCQALTGEYIIMQFAPKTFDLRLPSSWSKVSTFKKSRQKWYIKLHSHNGNCTKCMENLKICQNSQSNSLHFVIQRKRPKKLLVFKNKSWKLARWLIGYRYLQSNQSSSPGTHRMKGENWPSKGPLTSACTLWHAPTHPRSSKCKKIFK